MFDHLRRAMHLKPVQVGPITEYLGRWIWFLFLLACLASPVVYLITELIGAMS